MPERDLVKMTTEQHRESPFPTNVNIKLFGDAGWTEGVAYPLRAKPWASIGYGTEAEKERLAGLRQTRSKV